MEMEFTVDSLSIWYPRVSLGELKSHLSALDHADPILLARLLPDRERQKFDQYVHPELLDSSNSTDRLDLKAALNSVHMALRETGDSTTLRDHAVAKTICSL